MKLFEASRNSSRCMMSPTNSERGPLVALYKRVVNCNGSVGYPSALKRLCRICSSISIHRGARLAASVPNVAAFCQETVAISNHCFQRFCASAALASAGIWPVIVDPGGDATGFIAAVGDVRVV